MRSPLHPLALAVALVVSPARGQDGYTFVVDGVSVTPGVVSLAGTPNVPATGDLVAIGDWLLRLDDPGFHVYRDERGRLVRESHHGDVVVGLDAAQLVSADAVTRAGLRAVLVDRWDEGVAAALATLEPTVPLVVRCGAVFGPRDGLPPLPPAVQFLRIDWDQPRGFRDLSAAEPLRELRVLEFTGTDLEHVEIDLRPFRRAAQLRHLDLAKAKVVDGAGVVRQFGELRTFLGENLHVLDFAWFENLRELRHVRCAGLVPSRFWSKPPSLQPLANLPHLTTVALRLARLESLPVHGFAELRLLNLESCRVPYDAVVSFRRSHPQCRVVAGIDPSQLQSMLANVDHVLVRTGGTCHRAQEQERVLFESSETEILRTVAGMLNVLPGDSFHCMCCGSPTLVFSQHGRVVAEIGVHHGQSVRWAGGPWSSDANLAPAAADALVQWLAEHGDPGPRAERLRAAARNADEPDRPRESR